MKPLPWFFPVVLFSCCLTGIFEARAAETPTNAEIYRPAYHYSPERNWINDPAGLIFDGSQYHLFNQYNPYGDQWGHMSWSHVVSSDLIHWRSLPLALAEEKGVAIFTGSTVLDAQNSSGFGKGGKPPLVAIYTGDSGNLETQNLAYSTDGGLSWAKYAGNPVLDLHEKDFRDPKVFWYAPKQYWVMVVSLAAQRKVQFYSSQDLKAWSKLSEFGPAGANAAPNWECPNFFPLKVENQPGVTKWVLEVGIGGNGPTGGSASQYFVGDFNGVQFANANPSNLTFWADAGADFYAMQVYSNIPEESGQIAMAWMTNLNYAGKQPTSPWRGESVFPRVLGLRATREGMRLTQQPVAQIKELHEEHFELRNASWNELQKLLASRAWPQTIEMEATFEAGQAGDFGLLLRKGESHATRVGFDAEWSRLYVDRTRSGEVVVAPGFAARHEAPMSTAEGRVQMHILLDRSSVEVFGNDGLVSITDLLFPRPQDNGMGAYSTGTPPKVISFDLWTLKR